jgi:HK97 family phage portal protein
LQPFWIDAREVELEQRSQAIARREQALQLREKRAPLTPLDSGRAWLPYIQESYTGAWQENADPLVLETAVTNPTVFACVSRIAQDIGKMRWYLAEKTQNLWVETTSPSFSPVLHTPNRYQTRMQFLEWWITSLLLNGNTYVLKERDRRGVVVALYILDPLKCTPMTAPDASVYYELKKDPLATLTEERVIVPASEIMHDRVNAFFHALIGLSPLIAGWTAANQGLTIQGSSSYAFTNQARPSGILMAPMPIAQDTADRIKAKWQEGFGGSNSGKVAVLGGGMSYIPVTPTTANDSQLIDQLNWTDERICAVFHMPRYKVKVGPDPTYNNIEALNQQYYDDALHPRVKAMELLMGAGLSLPTPYGVKFQESDLLRMDTATKIQSIKDAIGAGFLSPNEGRAQLNLLPVPGGDTPYLQQQNFSLSALDRRDQTQTPVTPGIEAPASTAPSDEEPDVTKAVIAAMQRKALVSSLTAGL